MPIITGGGNLTLTVQVCFNQDPNDPAPPTAVWSDITQRCSNIRWSRGRQYELDKVEPGQFSAQVNNDDGALTPGNFGSPFYPGVVLYRQIQVLATYQSVSYTLFTGFVTQWPQGYNSAGQRPATTLAAVDALGLLALVKLKGWGVDAYSLLGCTTLYPLNDAAGATLFGASIGSSVPATIQYGLGAPSTAVVAGTSFDATMPGFSGSTYTSVAPTTVGGSDGGYIVFPTSVIPASGAWTMSFWARETVHTLGFTCLLEIMSLPSPSATAELTIYANSSSNDQCRFFGRNLAGSIGFSNTLVGPVLTDGQWHLISLSLSADHLKLSCVVDTGTPVTLMTATSPVISFASMASLAIGGLFNFSSQTGACFTGGLANFAIFPSDLCSDPTNPLQTILYPAGRTAFAGDTTGTRAKRIAQAAGFGAQFTSY